MVPTFHLNQLYSVLEETRVRDVERRQQGPRGGEPMAAIGLSPGSGGV